jgi:hypothetical protein
MPFGLIRNDIAQSRGPLLPLMGDDVLLRKVVDSYNNVVRHSLTPCVPSAKGIAQSVTTKTHSEWRNRQNAERKAYNAWRIAKKQQRKAQRV